MAMFNNVKRLFLAILPFFIALSSISCDENPADNEDESSKLRINILAGNNQTERIGAYLANDLVVSVTNILGKPYSGIPVAFSTTNSGAIIEPYQDITDSYGFASCKLQLGTVVGEYYVKAAIEGDTTIFTATAEDTACSEEMPGRVTDWPPGHIFITTTSSSLLSGSGSVVIDFDPSSKSIEKVLETEEQITDISFSSRGELFLTTKYTVFKINSDTHVLEEFGSYSDEWNVEIEPNAGGILVGISADNIFSIECPPEYVVTRFVFEYAGDVNWECLAAHPVTRDLYTLADGPTMSRMYKLPWDGRSDIENIIPENIYITTGTAVPRGMCIDSIGTIYISLDGNDTFRRIARVSPDGEVTDEFFNFFDHAGANYDEAGRWGDITILDGNLYIIDKRNDRLVIISDEGEWLDEIKNTAFSMQYVETERYGITASPVIATPLRQDK